MDNPCIKFPTICDVAINNLGTTADSPVTATTTILFKQFENCEAFCTKPFTNDDIKDAALFANVGAKSLINGGITSPMVGAKPSI